MKKSSADDVTTGLIKTLQRSEMFREYERAFLELTGLPLALEPAGSWQLPFHGKPRENHFCALIAANSHTCAACLQLQDKLYRDAVRGPTAITCQYGFSEIAVPVALGNQIIGFLRTGQALCNSPDAHQFEHAVVGLNRSGIYLESQDLKEAYLRSPVISKKKLDAMLHLLSIFANHLAGKSNEVVISQASAEPLIVTRGRKYVNDHLTEKLSLTQVAKAVGANTFHFCKTFKAATGLCFTEFVSRVRVEKAKNLLPNHQLQIGDVAYQSGFQSLTHFNRMFRRIVGKSPSVFRRKTTKLSASFAKSRIKPESPNQLHLVLEMKEGEALANGAARLHPVMN